VREAEELAAEWMRWMGFADAHVTGWGPDDGINVVATGAVAQIKMEAKPAGRPVVQALVGVAHAEGAVPLLFAMAGWTSEAKTWAKRANVALFGFTRDGTIQPHNPAARRIFSPPSQTVTTTPLTTNAKNPAPTTTPQARPAVPNQIPTTVLPVTLDPSDESDRIISQLQYLDSTLATPAKHKDSRVRAAAAENPACPPEVLAALLKRSRNH